jgi:hypothetical protein
MYNLYTIILFVIPTIIYINGIKFLSFHSQKVWVQNTNTNTNTKIDEFIKKINIPKWLIFNPYIENYTNSSENENENEYFTLITSILPFV